MAQGGVMGAVSGGVGAGVQPQNSQNTPGPATSAANQTATNSTPQVTPQVAPAAAPQGSGPSLPGLGGVPGATMRMAQTVYGAAKSPIEAQVDAGLKSEQDSDVLARLDELDNKTDQNSWLGQAKNYLRNQIDDFKNQVGGAMRIGAARTPAELQTGLKAAWGDKVSFDKNGGIVMKLDNGKTRKFANADEFLEFQEPMLLYVKNAMQAPGALTQLATQSAGASFGGLLGFLSPVPGGAAAGAVAGGAVGGYYGNQLSRQVRQGLNDFLGQSDPTYEFHNSVASLGDALQNDYVQAVIGGVTGGFQRAVTTAADNVLAQKIGEEPLNVIKGMNAEETTWGKFASSLKVFRDAFIPSTLKEGESAGENALKGMAANMDALGNKLGAIKNEMEGLQTSTGQYCRAEKFESYVRDTLKDFRVPFNRDGSIDYSTMNARVSPKGMAATAPKGLQDLMNLYDESIHSKYSDEGGLTVAQIDQFKTKLKEGTNFNAKNLSDTASIYNDAHTAINADYATHADSLFKAEPDSAAKDLLKNTMAEYASKQHAYEKVNSIFVDEMGQPDPNKLTRFEKMLSAPGNAKAAETMATLEDILGPENPNYKNVKSSMFDRFIDQATDGGKAKPEAISGYFKSGDNNQMLNMLLPDKKAQLTLQNLLKQGELGTGPMTPGASALLKGFVDFVADKIPGGKTTLDTIGQTFGWNKQFIDRTSGAILDKLNQALAPQQRTNLMQTYHTIEDFTAKAKIVDVPLKEGVGFKRYVPASVPITARSAAQIAGGPSSQGAGVAPQSPSPQGPAPSSQP